MRRIMSCFARTPSRGSVLVRMCCRSDTAFYHRQVLLILLIAVADDAVIVNFRREFSLPSLQGVIRDYSPI